MLRSAGSKITFPFTFQDLRPAVIPVPLTLRLFQFLLPDLLRARNSYALAPLHSVAIHQLPAHLLEEFEIISRGCLG